MNLSWGWGQRDHGSSQSPLAQPGSCLLGAWRAWWFTGDQGGRCQAHSSWETSSPSTRRCKECVTSRKEILLVVYNPVSRTSFFSSRLLQGCTRKLGGGARGALWLRAPFTGFRDTRRSWGRGLCISCFLVSGRDSRVWAWTPSSRFYRGLSSLQSCLVGSLANVCFSDLYLLPTCLGP